MREEILVEHFAHELEEVHLALVVGLALEQAEQRVLPLAVVDGLDELPDHGRDPQCLGAGGLGAGRRAVGGRRVERERVRRVGRLRLPLVVRGRRLRRGLRRRHQRGSRRRLRR